MKLQTSLTFCLIFWLTLFIHFKPRISLVNNGYQIVELDNDASCFISDSASWYASSKMTSTVYSLCSTTYLIGGYGVLGYSVSPYNSGEYFYKSYTGLPDHNYIRFSFTIFALDSWDQINTDGMNHNDAFKVAFDGLTIYAQAYYYGSFASLGNLCGTTTYSDMPNVHLFGYVPHMGSTLTLKFISDLNEISTNESFGFRELILLFDRNPPPSPETETICGVPPTTAITLTSNVCTCVKGQYYTGSACASCNAACASCYGSTIHDCYACASGYSWDGYACVSCSNSFTDICSFTATTAPSLRCKTGFVYFATTIQCYYDCKYPLVKSSVSCSTDQCTLACSLTQFTYWDQSCSATCAAPLQQSTVWTVPLCIYPCGSADYLYWDGTCQPDCPPPFTKSTIKSKNLCTTTCTSSQYVYPDGSCQSSCPSPLISETIQGRNICKSPCNTPGEYLYANGECSSTCETLFTGTTTLGIQYCTSSCANYIYWNSTCLSTCSRPLSIRTQRGQKYCDYPTATANFLYWDGTSSSSCSSPLSQRIEGGRQFCDYTCSSWQYLYGDGSCLTDCVFPWTKRVQGGQRFCDYPCSGTDILFWNGSCIAASECTTPLALTSLNSYQLCQFPTGNTSDFLYWDGTFSETCDPPFTQRIEGDPMVRKFCDNPCSSPTPILNWDGQCIASCTSPYTTVTQGTKSMCFTSCTDQYLYDDGTCQDDCIFPYVSVVYGAQKVCHNPCSNNNPYYYWNSSCLSSCDAPYQSVTVNDVQWCVYPCSGEQFVRSDGSCVDSCEKPFESYVVSSLKHCYNPCDFYKPYITQDGTCIASCDSPMSLDTTTNICSPPCERADQFYYAADGECRDECDEAYVDSSDLYIQCLSSAPVDTTSFLDVFLSAPSGSTPSLVSLVRVLQYTRYLDIDFPTNLENLFQSQATNIVTIRMGSSMSSETRATFPKYSLPHVFSQYSDLHSNFVVNFWKEITSWLIGSLLVLLFAAFEALARKKQWNGCENVFWKLKTLVKWNYVLIMIGSSLGQIVLYSSLQLRSIHFGASFSAFGTELALAMIFLGLVLLLGVPYVVQEARIIVTGNYPQGYNKNQNKWRPYQILYKGFSDDIYSTKLFYLIYAVRLCLPFLIASWCYFSPIFQTLLYTIISVLTLAYIWKAQPILRRLNQIQLVVLESLVLFINVGLFLLAILNASGKSQTSFAVSMGDLIVFANTCINLLFLVVLVLKVILALKAISNFNSSLNKNRLDLHPWPQLFVGIMQQGGMGFEEIDFEEFAVPDDDDFRSGMLVTDKGIKAKGRSWDSVRRNTKRIIPDNMMNSAIHRRNFRISQLFKVSEEFDPPESSVERQKQENLKAKQMINEATPGYRNTKFMPNQKNRPLSQSTASPIDEEKSNLEDQINSPPGSRGLNESQRSLRRRINHRGTFLVDMAEQGAFAGQDEALEKEREKENEKNQEKEENENGDVPLFVDPDLMKGVTMADLKKMDLRDQGDVSQIPEN